ncbi:hypothetical protein BJ742DRAFT_791701 [Cladochytrium replicatum]|nr:hypothetical protein BJ742DRAFT_791701 [Cladochytrium replicatum]
MCIKALQSGQNLSALRGRKLNMSVLLPQLPTVTASSNSTLLPSSCLNTTDCTSIIRQRNISVLISPSCNINFHRCYFPWGSSCLIDEDCNWNIQLFVGSQDLVRIAEGYCPPNRRVCQFRSITDTGLPCMNSSDCLSHYQTGEVLECISVGVISVCQPGPTRSTFTTASVLGKDGTTASQIVLIVIGCVITVCAIASCITVFYMIQYRKINIRRRAPQRQPHAFMSFESAGLQTTVSAAESEALPEYEPRPENEVLGEDGPENSVVESSTENEANVRETESAEPATSLHWSISEEALVSLSRQCSQQVLLTQSDSQTPLGPPPSPGAPPGYEGEQSDRIIQTRMV